MVAEPVGFEDVVECLAVGLEVEELEGVQQHEEVVQNTCRDGALPFQLDSGVVRLHDLHVAAEHIIELRGIWSVPLGLFASGEVHSTAML